MNIISDETFNNKKFATTIIHRSIFWIEEFKKYNQPTYIKADVEFYNKQFSKLVEELNELLDSEENIAFFEQDTLKYLSTEESKEIILMLLEKCHYYKHNISALISDKVQEHRTKNN